MKVEGTEKEMKELFKEKSKPWNSKKLWPKDLTDKQKGIIFISILVMAVILISVMALSIAYDLNDDFISQSECNVKVRTAVDEQISNTLWQQYLFIYSPFIKLFILAIALAWIIHGVGFHLVKR